MATATVAPWLDPNKPEEVRLYLVNLAGSVLRARGIAERAKDPLAATWRKLGEELDRAASHCADIERKS